MSTKFTQLDWLTQAIQQETDECILWPFSIFPCGYGQIYIPKTKRRNWYAHRTAYSLVHGPIPHGMFVCHTCDVPRCVNPAHLFLGTPNDNVQDMIRKGRQRKGLYYWQFKLTYEQVKEIRAAYIPHVVSTITLAKKYGVHPTTIFGIVKGRQRTHY